MAPDEKVDVWRPPLLTELRAEDWNSSPYWQAHYARLFSEENAWRCEFAVYCEVDQLMRMLISAGELPRSSPTKLLDAGCGIALLPQVLAYWGFEVTAVDICPAAVEFAMRHRSTEADLAKCIPIWQSDGNSLGTWTLVEDPSRSLERLREFQSPGGVVNYSVGDWFTLDLAIGGFDVIHCQNSLRRSTAEYWRRSLLRFHELLKPGGVLLLQTVNVLEIHEEVFNLLDQCGFVEHLPDTNRKPSSKYFISIWPTG